MEAIKNELAIIESMEDDTTLKDTIESHDEFCGRGTKFKAFLDKLQVTLSK